MKYLTLVIFLCSCDFKMWIPKKHVKKEEVTNSKPNIVEIY